MVDKVKPLGIESSATGGTEDEQIPTEMNPAEDYAAIKGIAFEGSDDFRYEKFYRVLVEHFPFTTQLVTYSGGDITTVEYFNSATQITANRIAKITIGYTSGDPTSETVEIFQSDGSTVARTITSTFTYTSGDITGISRVES